ncbi:MAG TPA: sigma-70 family RNA polymerase sigma factor [Solirubrobacteraceae bacterium]|nr:sigma-70 family RNA polymerase sigma factor [Solirubrobacteraceae bacterium]
MSASAGTDAGLVARCRAGEEAAWAELVSRYSRYVYAIAIRAYRLEEIDAEDVFQEVFARTYEHLDRLRDDGAIRPWLGQLTRRLAIDRLRAGRREAAPPAAEMEPGAVDEALERIDDAVALRTALDMLSEPCQDVLDRFFARDESYATIAAALDIPSGTIASRISRCLAKLRIAFEGRNGAADPS